jgi:ubiquinone/menaquinone biosynthesis C-methylase UbiE
VARYDDEIWRLVPDDAAPSGAHLVQFVRALGHVERALDLGCGDGRLTAELDAAELVATDVSVVALERARERLPGAELVHLQPDEPLPVDDNGFDLVLCAETIEHVRDVQLLLSESRRVLRPGGRLVAATLADENLSELWAFLGSPRERALTFSSANGAGQLAAHFERVEAREAEGVVVFPTPDAMRAYVAANMTRAHLAAVVPSFTEPVRARTHHTVFVADKEG